MPSAKDINSQVIEIDFKASPDADPTIVKGLSEPVTISIPMDSKVLHVYRYICFLKEGLWVKTKSVIFYQTSQWYTIHHDENNQPTYILVYVFENNTYIEFCCFNFISILKIKFYWHSGNEVHTTLMLTPCVTILFSHKCNIILSNHHWS